jgi:hypothetical protein
MTCGEKKGTSTAWALGVKVNKPAASKPALQRARWRLLRRGFDVYGTGKQSEFLAAKALSSNRCPSRALR